MIDKKAETREVRFVRPHEPHRIPLCMRPCLFHFFFLLAHRRPLLRLTATVAQIFESVRSICRAVRNSSKLTTALAEAQRRRGVKKPLGLILDVTTRWLSLYDMLSRFLDLLPPLLDLGLAGLLNGVSEALVALKSELFLTGLATALEPIASFVRLAEGESYTTLSMVPVLFARCLRALELTATDMGALKRYKNDLAGALKRRLGYLLCEPNMALAAAALDPNYGHLLFVEDDSARDAVCIR